MQHEHGQPAFSKNLAFNAVLLAKCIAGDDGPPPLCSEFVDPERQFGSPIVEETGTPTSVLYASYLAEGATQHAVLQTSRAYETSAKLVESAIRYEEFLRRTVH